MKDKSYMTISEFARITGIKRENLIFYDNVGLLPPELRGDNGYRYYARRQLGTAYLILSLRELGLGLKEIQKYAKERTPKKMISLLQQQDKRIEKEMNQLKRMKELMGMYKSMAEEAMEWGSEEITVREQEKEPIFLGEMADPSQSNAESSMEFYEYAEKQGMVLGYPMGCIIKERTLKDKEPMKALRTPTIQYYFKVKHGHNAYKPAGKYVVACGCCGYGESDFVYEKVLRFIKEQGLFICGNAYEEYPLNEMAVKDDSQYCVKVEIMVKS